MQPFVREYINDINAFISQGVDQENFYVLSHDD